jgi:hypothetical protein
MGKNIQNISESVINVWHCSPFAERSRSMIRHPLKIPVIITRLLSEVEAQ